MILRGTSVLPATFTLLNGLLGFASIHMACRGALGDADISNWGDISIAAWLIFGAMICDMLDGRLARWTRKTSDFGGQLDSLSDVVSFGVAPAVLMLRTVMTVLRGNVQRINFMPDPPVLERAFWCVAAVYMAFAALRLARFNVENEPDEQAHMHFRGLPSPGAASVVAAMSLLFVRLVNFNTGWRANPDLLAAVGLTLPVATLVAAVLMITRFRYPHLVNQYVRGKKPFGYLVKLLVVIVAATIEPFMTAAAVALAYALWGPVAAVWRRLHTSPVPAPPPGPGA